MDKIIDEIEKSRDKKDATERLFGLLEHGDEDFTANSFVEASSRRFSVERLMIYLIAYKNDAKDWASEKYRIRAEANGSYRPEWHHIFPRKWLRCNVKNIDEHKIDSVANMAVISQVANRKIGASAPSTYVREMDIASLLDDQIIPDPTYVGPDQYEDWLKNRAGRLAREANEYVSQLRSES